MNEDKLLSDEELLSNCCGASDIYDGNLCNNEGVCFFWYNDVRFDSDMMHLNYESDDRGKYRALWRAKRCRL